MKQTYIRVYEKDLKKFFFANVMNWADMSALFANVGTEYMEQNPAFVSRRSNFLDKNGKPIYENDLLKVPNNSHLLLVSVAGDDSWELVEYRKNGAHELLLKKMCEVYGQDVEVVGNVFEKELGYDSPYGEFTITTVVEHPSCLPPDSAFPVAVLCDSVDGHSIKTADNFAEYNCIRELFNATAWYSIRDVATEYWDKTCATKAE